jgi:hypothetical protein
MYIRIRAFVLIALSAGILSMLSCAPAYDNIADQMLADTQKQADEILT